MSAQSDFDPFTIDRLLDGMTTGPSEVRAVVDALSAPAQPNELLGQHSVIDAMAAVVTTAPTVAASTPRVRRLSARTGALAAAGALAFSGVAAAATGVPIPVVESVFGNDEPALVELGEGELDDLGLSESEDEGAGTDAGQEANDGNDADDGSAPALAADETEEKDGDSKDDLDEGADDGADGADVEKDNHGAAVSEAAKSDCGKKNVEPQPEDCDADNHGEFVREVAKQNGKAGENGNAENNANGNNKTESSDDGAAESTDDTPDAQTSEAEEPSNNGGGKNNGKGKGKNKN